MQHPFVLSSYAVGKEVLMDRIEECLAIRQSRHRVKVHPILLFELKYKAQINQDEIENSTDEGSGSIGTTCVNEDEDEDKGARFIETGESYSEGDVEQENSFGTLLVNDEEASDGGAAFIGGDGFNDDEDEADGHERRPTTQGEEDSPRETEEEEQVDNANIPRARADCLSAADGRLN